MRPLIPLFWIFLWRLSWVSKPGWIPRLQNILPRLHATDSSNSPLVWHLLTSWWTTLQPSLNDPRTCTRTSIGGTRPRNPLCRVAVNISIGRKQEVTAMELQIWSMLDKLLIVWPSNGLFTLSDSDTYFSENCKSNGYIELYKTFHIA